MSPVDRLATGVLTGALIVTLAAGPAPIASATWWPAANQGSAESNRRGEVSLEDAVARVQRATGATVIAAETRLVDGRAVHFVKVLSRDGRVRIYRVDARSGRMTR